MKTKEELELHLRWLDENIKPLIEKKKAVETALKALEKPEFDFKNKMPVGSVWLGNLTVNSWERKTITFVRQNDEEMPATIYHAHQIVKAAQEWREDNNRWAFDASLHYLFKSLEAAEQDGVLQNIE